MWENAIKLAMKNLFDKVLLMLLREFKMLFGKPISFTTCDKIELVLGELRGKVFDRIGELQQGSNEIAASWLKCLDIE